MMIVHSQWRVKVAISLVLCVVVHGAIAQWRIQDAYQKNITIRGQHIALETVLQQLSAQTGLYFIYSSDAVELKKPLTVTMQERPLHEVLSKISEIARVKFRREGNYVVVKAIQENRPVEQRGKPIVIKKEELVAQATVGNDEVTNPRTTSSPFRFSSSIPAALLNKNLLHCPTQLTAIDTSGLKKYFPLSITNPSAKRYLFTSFNFMLNEYSAGAEIRAGLPYLYAVVSSGRLQKGNFRHGIGIGTSLKIKPTISLNPIYTFATARTKEDYIIEETRNLMIKDGLKITGRHHQFKLLLQIHLSDKFRMQIGPTFNSLKTSYAYQKAFVLVSEYVASSVSTPYGKYTQIGLVRSLYYSPPSDYSTLKSWVGFETGVSYHLKFSRR